MKFYIFYEYKIKCLINLVLGILYFLENQILKNYLEIESCYQVNVDGVLEMVEHIFLKIMKHVPNVKMDFVLLSYLIKIFKLLKI